MNKTYRLDFFLNVIDGSKRFYRLNRSVTNRNTKKILNTTIAKSPIGFFYKNKKSRRNTFHYKENYVEEQNLAREVRRFYNFDEIEITLLENARAMIDNGIIKSEWS